MAAAPGQYQIPSAGRKVHSARVPLPKTRTTPSGGSFASSSRATAARTRTTRRAWSSRWHLLWRRQPPQRSPPALLRAPNSNSNLAPPAPNSNRTPPPPTTTTMQARTSSIRSSTVRRGMRTLGAMQLLVVDAGATRRKSPLRPPWREERAQREAKKPRTRGRLKAPQRQ